MSLALSKVWCDVARPWMVSQRRSPKTLVSYAESLSVWVRSTGDPVVTEVIGSHVAKFHAELASLVPKRGSSVSDFTRRKHVRQVLSLLRYCLAATDDCPVGVGLLSSLPSLGRVKARGTVRGCWLPADVVALCAAADQMKAPRFCWAVPLWWRSLVAFAYATGYRRQTLLGLRWRHIDGTWCDPPQSICKRGSSVRQFLNADAVQALELASVFRESDPNTLIWDWPHDVRYFDRQLRVLCLAAGLSGDRVTGLHAARRGHATALSLVSSDAAQASLGHASQDTTVKHYLSSEVVRVALLQLPGVLGS